MTKSPHITIRATQAHTALMRALAQALGYEHDSTGNVSKLWRHIAAQVEEHGAEVIARRLGGDDG